VDGKLHNIDHFIENPNCYAHPPTTSIALTAGYIRNSTVDDTCRNLANGISTVIPRSSPAQHPSYSPWSSKRPSKRLVNNVMPFHVPARHGGNPGP
jgi:hypothetical protein